MGHSQEEKGLRIVLEKNIRQLVLFVFAIAAIESIVLLSRIHRGRDTFTVDVPSPENRTVPGNEVESVAKVGSKRLLTNDSVSSHVGPKKSKSPTSSSKKSPVGKTKDENLKNFSTPNGSLNSDGVAKNARCLQHLLDLDIVEYYYYPEGDDNNLNFTVRGSVSKTRFPNEKSRPSLVSRGKPTYDRTFDTLSVNNTLQRNLCISEIINFLPNMMARDYDLLRNLIKFFKHVAALTGMEYYLNYGSLLGHVRFDRRPIPWDDDLDFSVDYSVLKKFSRIFKRERRLHFGNHTNTGSFYPDLYIGKVWAKVFDASQTKVDRYNWTFPFIDLFFYRLTNDDFYDLPVEELDSLLLMDGLNSGSAYNLSLDIAMPFKKDLFLGIELPVPADALKVLKRLHYSTTKCKPLWWYHRYEKGKTYPTSSAIKCSRLEGFYDFSENLWMVPCLRWSWEMFERQSDPFVGMSKSKKFKTYFVSLSSRRSWFT